MTGVLPKRGNWEQTPTEAGPWEGPGRRQPPTSQGGVASEEVNPANTWPPSPQNCAEMKFCRLSHSVCGILLWKPYPINTWITLKHLCVIIFLCSYVYT